MAESTPTDGQPQRCSLCRALETTAVSRSGKFGLVRCANCRLVRIDPFPFEQEVDAIYGEEYYTSQPAKPGAGLGSRVRSMILECCWGYPSRLGRVARKAFGVCLWPLKGRVMPIPFIADAPVLDIGCGNGQRLAELETYGSKSLYGVETSPGAAREARRASRARIVHGTVESASFPSDHFELVIMNQVLEHVPSPLATLREVWRILRPDGALYLTVPNYGSIEARFFGAHWSGLKLPEHLHQFEQETLCRVLADAGFRVTFCRTDSLFSVTRESFVHWARAQQGRVGALLMHLPGIVLRAAMVVTDLASSGSMLRVVAMPAHKVSEVTTR